MKPERIQIFFRILKEKSKSLASRICNLVRQAIGAAAGALKSFLGCSGDED